MFEADLVSVQSLVAQLWPRSPKMHPERGKILVTFLQPWNVEQVLEAIRLWASQHPDATKPSWDEVAHILHGWIPVAAKATTDLTWGMAEETTLAGVLQECYYDRGREPPDLDTVCRQWLGRPAPSEHDRHRVLEAMTAAHIPSYAAVRQIQEQQERSARRVAELRAAGREVPAQQTATPGLPALPSPPDTGKAFEHAGDIFADEGPDLEDLADGV